MIPKKIHYCWFGKGELSPLAKKCIKSWKTHCPDYEIIEWNEDNFDFSKYPYAAYCFEKKKYAFLSDFVRLVVLLENGGFYFDTDVELLKRPDEFLKNEAVFGFETDEYINTGEGFACEINQPAVRAMLDEYLFLTPDENGDYEFIGCPRLNTKALLPHGLLQNGKIQTVLGALILPSDYMNPYDDPTGTLKKTENTLSIHWYSKSWMSKKTILRSKLSKPIHRLQKRLEDKK